MKNKQLPKTIDLNSVIKDDAKKINRIFKKVGNRIKKTKGIEGFLLSWAFIEQLTLPSLIKLIAHKLKFKELPNLEGIKTFQLIQIYYFLSHDYELYKRFCVLYLYCLICLVSFGYWTVMPSNSGFERNGTGL